MSGSEIRMALSLPPEEALARLQARALWVQSFLFSFKAVWGAPPEKTVIGSFWENKFVLRKRHWYSNGLQPILEGRIEPAEDGSILVARFRRLQPVVWLVWIIIVAYALISIYLFWLEPYEPGSIITAWIMSGATVFIFFINFFARWLGDRDRPHLRAFIGDSFSDVRRS